MKGITVIGCGTMGSRLINAFMNGGFEISIVDLNEEAAKPFVARGARYYKNLDESDDTECVLINLPNHAIAKKVMDAANKDKLKGRMLINTTTSTPDEVKDMDAFAAEAGMIHLDAKIGNYPGDIGTQNAYLLYSGSEEVFNKMKPALEALGQTAYLGDNVVGASLTDIAVLEVHYGAIATMAESAAYCLKNDYPIETFIEQTRKILPIMLEGNYRAFIDGLKNYNGEFEDASECTLNMETIAIETLLKAMKGDGVATPCGDVIVDLFKKGLERGNGKKNVVAIVNEMM